MAYSWTCPHCETLQTVTHEMRSQHDIKIGLAGFAEEQGKGIAETFGYSVVTVRCANRGCNRIAVTFTMGLGSSPNGPYRINLYEPFLTKTIYPDASHRNFPDFVPQPIREDYEEACRIRLLSPKASATLARRCIQGMIRDFCGIIDKTLYREIERLSEAVATDQAPKGVDEESVRAIDHVRKIGNIGAHMEADVNFIVPVDPDEAQALIELIEMLITDWYIAREARAKRLARIEAINAAKDEVRAAPTVDIAPTDAT